MPDHRRHRGKHPGDEELFAARRLPALKQAVHELSWLLTRGYNETSALKLVGDRHALTVRQRKAVSRGACSDGQREVRRAGLLAPEQLAGQEVHVDAFNLLIILESALSGGVLLVCRDGCYRDLASIHGSYRQVEETSLAVRCLGLALQRLGAGPVRLFLDAPVSNSGRLKASMAEAAAAAGWDWDIQLHPNPDRVLIQSPAVVATSDGWILDSCQNGWVDLPGLIIPRHVPGAWVVDLQEP